MDKSERQWRVFSVWKMEKHCSGYELFVNAVLQQGAVTVSASDEITEIPEQSIVYWSMKEEDEPQADVIREAVPWPMKKQQVFL